MSNAADAATRKVEIKGVVLTGADGPSVQGAFTVSVDGGSDQTLPTTLSNKILSILVSAGVLS